MDEIVDSLEDRMGPMESSVTELQTLVRELTQKVDEMNDEMAGLRREAENSKASNQGNLPPCTPSIKRPRISATKSTTYLNNF